MEDVCAIGWDVWMLTFVGVRWLDRTVWIGRKMPMKMDKIRIILLCVDDFGRDQKQV